MRLPNATATASMRRAALSSDFALLDASATTAAASKEPFWNVAAASLMLASSPTRIESCASLIICSAVGGCIGGKNGGYVSGSDVVTAGKGTAEEENDDNGLAEDINNTLSTDDDDGDEEERTAAARCATCSSIAAFPSLARREASSALLSRASLVS
jgi:hypothetical protein